MANDQPVPGSSRLPGLASVLFPEARIGGARYILKRILGSGPITEAWLAQDAKLGLEVALKVLPAAIFQNPNLIERLKSEVGPVLDLDHPHIARTYELVQDHRAVAISMELVDGWSLAALRVDKPEKRFQIDEITPWIRQLCSALAYAHNEAKILHLDLKSSNLLLNSRSEIKVTDFAFTRTIHSLANPTELKLAAEGLGFMSPQQALGEEPSVLDDIYGLGATLFDLLTGTPPFYKGQILAQVCQLPAPRMSDRLAELGIKDPISIVVEDTVAQCLAKDPEKRPQSIEEVLRLLERSDVPVAIESVEPKEEPVATEPEPIPEPVASIPEVEAPAEEEMPATAPVSRAGTSYRNPLLLSVCGTLAAFGLIGVLWLNHSGKVRAATVGGELDTSFDSPTNIDKEVRIALEQADQRVLIGGMFTRFGDDARRGIARLKADGKVDGSFSAATAGDVFALATQRDGKIVLGGLFASVNDHPCRRLARLNADGSLDESFTANAGVNGAVRAVLVQPDGKVLVAGNFQMAAGHRLTRIARFNADGTLDDGFYPGTGASSTIWSLALQPDGKILAGGDFKNFDGKGCGYIVRLNSNGAVDSSFGSGDGANNQVFAVEVQRDGKIVIGGDFTRINEEERKRLARLNPDGSLDMSFNPGAGPDKGVRCLAVDAGGRVVIGGVFESVHGVARGRIARLNADGSLDTTFNPAEGANEVVRCIVPLADGKIMIAGGFTKFADKDCSRIARLFGGT